MAYDLNPYVNFDGNCEEAMTFYAQLLGVKAEIMRFSDGPMELPPGMESKVMHATVAGEGFRLMASDTMPGSPTVAGTNFNLSLSVDSVEEQDRLWAALCEGGQVVMPLDKTFWGRFGICKDRFGMSWMLDLAHGDAKS